MCWILAVKKSTFFFKWASTTKLGFGRQIGFRPLTWILTAKIGFQPLMEIKFAVPLASRLTEPDRPLAHRPT